MESKILAKRTNYLVLIVVLLYIASQLIFSFAFGYEQIKQNFYLFVAFNQLFIILLPALIFVNREKLKPVEFFKIKRISIPEAILVILMAFTSSFIASALNSIVIFFMEKIGPVEIDNIPVAKSPKEFWLQVFVIALLPAICEELLFRGIIYNAFQGLGVKMSIVVSSIYFTLIHFDINNLLGPFFLGILIVWYCYRTGSIIAASLAHFTNNFLSILLNYISNNALNSEELAFEALTPQVLTSLIIFAAFAGGFLFIIMRSFEALTKNKVEAIKNPERTISLKILTHWPMWIFYGLYLFFTINKIIPKA
ncbi:MAG: type II CAAX endopeptidase family protein [Ruminiclostridium sp.]|nr:type II CAAX endopeptidase family protein [Ruminiclostridium sp.]